MGKVGTEERAMSKEEKMEWNGGMAQGLLAQEGGLYVDICARAHCSSYSYATDDGTGLLT